jgi:hypothetical protein
MSTEAESEEERELRIMLAEGNARGRRRALRAAIPVACGLAVAACAVLFLLWSQASRAAHNEATRRQGFGFIHRERPARDAMSLVVVPIGAGVATAMFVSRLRKRREDD